MEFDVDAGREKDGAASVLSSADAVLIGADAVRERHELALGRIRRMEEEKIDLKEETDFKERW